MRLKEELKELKVGFLKLKTSYFKRLSTISVMKLQALLEIKRMSKNKIFAPARFLIAMGNVHE